MKRPAHIACALLLDAVLGDPRWLPHPAKLTGRLAQGLEVIARRRIKDERLAGAVTAGLVVAAATLATAIVTGASACLSPRAKDATSILVLWTAFAARDLADHALDVHGALQDADLVTARTLVGRMVGRDVSVLDEAGVVRAVVESVGENTVDGVTSPLFYAYLGGPMAAAAYKAVNTLDSTFGYRNERYVRFGWASARSDDWANWVPARLTPVAGSVAAWITGLHPVGLLRACLRDGGKHASPNSGIAEAAMAGALGVQLGGPLMRGGVLSDYPTLGDPLEPLAARHISRAVRFMAVTTVVWAGSLWVGGALLVGRGFRAARWPLQGR
ncbi:MAG: cobalamin biosynthesis protein CobD [Thermoleophilia bacterium]|nr:cobalamin biosynthesis protein CobD [Thermoleophilia bacterium]